jgi:hypothetical protein
MFAIIQLLATFITALSDQTPNCFYRLLPNGKGWYWAMEKVQFSSAVKKLTIDEDLLLIGSVLALHRQ